MSEYRVIYLAINVVPTSRIMPLAWAKGYVTGILGMDNNAPDEWIEIDDLCVGVLVNNDGIRKAVAILKRVESGDDENA